MDTHDTTQETRGPGKNKRKWNDEEDAKLVEALLDMVHLGKFKAETGFKPGYLNYVEEKLQVVLPDSGLKAKPHIESRIRTLKRDFHIVYDMLNGPNTSGFGMDPIKKCVTAEKPVWDAYLKSRPAYATWKNKPFSFYDYLFVIFGRDRATGTNAEGPGDMMEDIHKEKNTDDNVEAPIDSGLDDFDSAFSPLQSPTNERINMKKKKKRIVGNSMAADMKEAASVIGMEIAKASELFGKAIGVDAEISEKRQQIDSEIRKMPDLTAGEVIKAVCEIAHRDELIDVFFSMTEEGTEQLVKAILNEEV
ncbi:hypothetical protein C2S52_009284 [Perilla frutescens var. hirtella]|nr:hypothetical protein C2S52_009284 [Perilla frutescens var. hirtella]